MMPIGRLVEVGGQAATTVLARLVVEAQREGEPVAWVTGTQTTLYPTDLLRAGVSLHALPILRINDDTRAKGLARIRAAEMLLRSGAFGLVVIEAPQGLLPARALSRLHAMARRHQTRVVFRRSEAAVASLGPLVALHLEAERDGHTLRFVVRKNKVPSALEEVLEDALLEEGEAKEGTALLERRIPLSFPDGLASARLSEPAQQDLFAAFASQGGEWKEVG